MEKIQRVIDVMLPQQAHLDALAVAVVDFQRGKFQAAGHQGVYFDLASVTKVLGHAAAFSLRPELFNADLRLLLEHRAGLPAWGLLPQDTWREVIMSYKPHAADTLYSDYSAMRVSLELEKLGHPVPALLKDVWDGEVCFWKDLPPGATTVKTGEREGRAINGEVHDPNAWVIGQWTGHAGLFGTVGGVARTLLTLEKQTGFIAQVKKAMTGHPHRFIQGWDRVENPAQTLAGRGCSAHTFGHLGFTGTSVWIDAQRGLGHVILSNATRDGWFCKEGLNEIRRAVGELVWSH